MSMTMQPYRYTESGLDNVFVHGVSFTTDEDEDAMITIPHVNELHRAIASALVTKPSSLVGRELRFLRTEMGMTQAELAAIVHREPLAISRWERGEVPDIDANAETLIRLHAREVLGLDIKTSVRDMAARSTPSAAATRIDIDGSDPTNYRPMPVAA